MSPDISRRTVVKGLGVGGVILGGAVVGWQVLDDGAAPPATTEPPPPPEPWTPLGVALVAVGRRYLDAVPEEADRDVLLAALPALGGTVPADPATGLAVLAPQVAEDHAAGETVVLDGWVLSRTEGRAAALYAL